LGADKRLITLIFIFPSKQEAIDGRTLNVDPSYIRFQQS